MMFWSCCRFPQQKEITGAASPLRGFRPVGPGGFFTRKTLPCFPGYIPEARAHEGALVSVDLVNPGRIDRAKMRVAKATECSKLFLRCTQRTGVLAVVDGGGRMLVVGSHRTRSFSIGFLAFKPL